SDLGVVLSNYLQARVTGSGSGVVILHLAFGISPIFDFHFSWLSSVVNHVGEVLAFFVFDRYIQKFLKTMMRK
ncbi:hypothetical protein KI387_034968, partial [Taxus chinensis]